MSNKGVCRTAPATPGLVKVAEPLKGNFLNHCSSFRGCATKVTAQDYFQRIFQFFLIISTQVFLSAQNPP